MIVTVTLNPALDLTYTFADDAQDDVQRAASSSLEASGKGVNISRALSNAGIPTCAVLPAGGATGRALVELLDDDGVAYRAVRQAGDTRVNTTALRPGGVTVKLNGPGTALSRDEQDDVLDQTTQALRAAKEHANDVVWLAICGSLPPGVDSGLIAALVQVAHAHGAKCAVDASGPALAAALGAGADVLAPNRQELAEVCPSVPVSGPLDQLADAARILARDTGAALLISLGPDGALYTDGRHVIHGRGPALTPVNTAGAGDALLAGWLAADGEPRERLARAVTWGRSACLADTTVDPSPGTGDDAPITVVDLNWSDVPESRTGAGEEEERIVSDIRRVIVDADHHVVVERIAAPTPGPGDALVRAVYSGVCGSDTHAQQGRHPHIRLPYAVGHEVVGIVEQVSADVTDLAPGDRVTVEPTLPCWTCKQCRAGRVNLCENLGFFGCGHAQGGMAESFTIPGNRLHRIPDDIDDLTATLIEPLSTPVHAARLAGPLEGKAVAILGAGSIGLLMLAVVKAQGAARIVVTDMLETKRARALARGADAVVDAAAEDVVAQVRTALGESADVVFDCVAIQSTLNQAVEMALKGGTVVIVGVPSRDVTMPVVLMQDQEVRVQGSATYLPEDFDAAIALLRAGAVTAADIVTGQFPLERADAAFDASSSGEHVKVLVKI